uniref:uncharacterized protein n=1 Tax=Myxine glutinosa TaxID=7769 RepID=UPI00358EBB25
MTRLPFGSPRLWLAGQGSLAPPLMQVRGLDPSPSHFAKVSPHGSSQPLCPTHPAPPPPRRSFRPPGRSPCTASEALIKGLGNGAPGKVCGAGTPGAMRQVHPLLTLTIGILAMDPGVPLRMVDPGVALRVMDPGVAARVVESGAALRMVDPGIAARVVEPGVAARMREPGVAARVAKPVLQLFLQAMRAPERSAGSASLSGDFIRVAVDYQDRARGPMEQGREERAPTSRNVVSRLLGSRLFHTTCRKYFHRIFHGTRDCMIPAYFRRCARLLSRLAASSLCTNR